MTSQTEHLGAPTLPEDVLLLLFQPDSGTIAGETTLFYVLAGAVLADLALNEHVVSTRTAVGTVKMEARVGREPSDEILRSAWDHIATRPRGVQATLAAIGPPLREPILRRLVDRGDLREENRKIFGFIRTRALLDGENGRRASLLADVRDVLANGIDPTPRTAALAALIWASGALPQFDRDIPWTSAVITRAQELTRGNWGAGAASEAVQRTVIAMIDSTVVLASTASGKIS